MYSTSSAAIIASHAIIDYRNVSYPHAVYKVSMVLVHVTSILYTDLQMLVSKHYWLIQYYNN